MLLDYKNLRNKYLKYFDNDEHYCDFVLADVVFGFSEVFDFLKKEMFLLSGNWFWDWHTFK